MRQIAGTFMVATLVLVAAAIADAENAKMSMQHLQSHNAKRVTAKLQSVAKARSMIEAQANRAKMPHAESMLPKKVKARRAEIAKSRSWAAGKLAKADARQMNVQQGSGPGSTPGAPGSGPGSGFGSTPAAPGSGPGSGFGPGAPGSGPGSGFGPGPSGSVGAPQVSGSVGAPLPGSGQGPSPGAFSGGSGIGFQSGLGLSSGPALHGGINAGAEQYFEGAEHCSLASKFRVLETRFHDVCARTDFSFLQRHWHNRGRANTAFEGFCTSECAGTINDLLAFQDGYSCFRTETLTELRMFSAMCQFSTAAPPAGATTLRCGAEVATSGVFSGQVSSCYLKGSKALCQTDTAACQWNRETQSCDEKITAATLALECNPCYESILGVFSQEINPICGRYKGQFCVPKANEFQSLMEADNWDFSQTVLDQVCADPAMIPCFRQQSIKWENGDLARARSTYASCIKDGFQTQDSCQQDFERSHQQIQESDNFWNTMCLKSANTTGSNCLHYSQGESTADLCLTGASASPTCTTDCATATATFLNDAGCCTPLLSWKPETTVDDFPEFDGSPAVNAGALSRQSADFTTWNVANMQTCSGVTALPDQANCPNPASTETYTIFTNLNYTRMVEVPWQTDNVLWALTLDLSTAAGVIATNLKVTIAAATVDSVAGTNIIIAIKGTPSFIRDAVATVKLAFESGTLRLENTDRMLRQCKECKPPTQNSVVSVAYPTIPGAPTDECGQDAFINDYIALVQACETTDVNGIFELYTSDFSVANAAWGKGCASQCLAKFKEVRAKSYGECIPTDVLSLGDLMNVGCEFDSGSTRRCGAVLSIMAALDCGSLSESECTGSTGQGHCRWNSVSSTCKDQFSNDFLEPLCNGGCISKLAATIGANSDGFGKEAKLMDNLFCSHDNNTLCLPHVQAELNAIDEQGLTVATVNGVCQERSKLRCMKRVFGALASDSIGLAELDFYYCVETTLDDSSISFDDKLRSIETNCIENVLAATLSAVDQTADMLNNMCSKNENGDLCMAFPDKYKSSTCLLDMLYSNVCPATCTSEIETILTDMGCCTGNLQEVHGFVPFANLPPEDIPEFEVFEDFGEDIVSSARRQQNTGGNLQPGGGGAGIDFGGPQHQAQSGPGFKVGAVPLPQDFTLGDPSKNEQLAMPKWYYLANYQTCPSATMSPGALVYKKCKKQRGTLLETRSLDLNLAFDTVAATPKKQARFNKKIQSDLGLKQGCSADDYPSFGIGRNDKKKIEVRGGKGRRQTSSQDTSTVAINVQTENNEDTANAVYTFDQAVASGTLTLTSTIALTKAECSSNCTAAGADATSLNGAATSVTVTTVTANSGSGSSSASAPNAAAGAASASMIAAAVIAALSAVLLI